MNLLNRYQKLNFVNEEASASTVEISYDRTKARQLTRIEECH